MGPETITAFQRRFSTEEGCLLYLVDQRRTKGALCGDCQRSVGEINYTRRIWTCRSCAKRVPILKGTIFEKSKKPLVTWFLAIRLFLDSRGGLTAADLKHLLDLGSYQTAWTWLRKLRQNAGRLFEKEPAGRGDLGTRIRAAVPRLSAVRSCAPLIREFVDRLSAVPWGKTRDLQHVKSGLTAWAESSGNRRAHPGSFLDRTAELGFHLTAKSRLGLEGFMGGLVSQDRYKAKIVGRGP